MTGARLTREQGQLVAYAYYYTKVYEGASHPSLEERDLRVPRSLWSFRPSNESPSRGGRSSRLNAGATRTIRILLTRQEIPDLE